MKEWIVGRNPVMEILLAKRREVFRVLLAIRRRGEGAHLRINAPGCRTQNSGGTSSARTIG